jgi:hypothetical protein
MDNIGGNPSTWTPMNNIGGSPSTWTPMNNYGGSPSTWTPPPSSAPIGPPTPGILGPGGEQRYYDGGLPYVQSYPGALRNELSSPFQTSGGILWRDDPNIFNQFDPFGTAAPLNTYTNDRGGRFSQYYTNGMF